MSTAHTQPASRSQHRKLLVLLGVVLLVLTQLLAYQLWLSYQEEIDNARTTTRNYAAIFEARFDATLRRTDTVLWILARTLPEAALGKAGAAHFASEVNAELDSRLLNFTELAGLRVFDANGDLRYASGNGVSTTINVADRSYFSLVRDNPQAGLVFSEVLAARTTGRQSVVAARALRSS